MLVIEPELREDNRGWFMETFSTAKFAANAEEYGLPTEFKQDNHSFSYKNVIRGLHCQFDPPQGKLVRCVRGTILDVAVDIRRDSPRFRQWVGVELTAANRRMLWIPEGFAHGFSVLSDEADVVYKCTTLWNQKGEIAIRWNDPSIGVDWQVKDPVVGLRDLDAPFLDAVEITSP